MFPNVRIVYPTKFQVIVEDNDHTLLGEHDVLNDERGMEYLTKNTQERVNVRLTICFN